MKVIGLLGGMSWESTVSYYKAINQSVHELCGGYHSAKICLYSVDFAEIEQLQQTEQWQQTADILSAAARAVEAGGAELLVLCTNTMHIVADQIQSSVGIPFLHIADATAEALLAHNIKTVGLLGTRFTMEQDFYRGRLKKYHGIDVRVPNLAQRQVVHKVIYSELCFGKISETSRQQYLQIIDELHANGAEAIVLGCTEIALLVEQRHTTVPLFDTTAIHARKAVELALG